MAMGDIVDKNADILCTGLSITEARLWMVMKAMDEMVGGSIRKTEEGVDWMYYLAEYQRVANTSAKESQKECAIPADESEHPADAVLFGGT